MYKTGRWPHTLVAVAVVFAGLTAGMPKVAAQGEGSVPAPESGSRDGTSDGARVPAVAAQPRPGAASALSTRSPHGSGSAGPARAASAPTPAAARQWIVVPRVWGRLTAKQLGLVINTADPYSVEVGEYYIKARGLTADQVLRVQLPVKPELTVAEFDALAQSIGSRFGERTQALALAWTVPYAVACNSLSGALAMGYDAKLCQNTCAASRTSAYFNSPTSFPYTELGLRPSMQLAARDVSTAKAMIDRGLAADGSLALRLPPLPKVHFVATSDAVRSQRQQLFPPAGKAASLGVDVELDQTDALRHAGQVLIYLTGRDRVADLNTVRFLPGALADHLTSFGGRLTDPYGQMSILSWIDAGATASYGAVSEPCAHLQKFAHPQTLLLYYAQGSTAIEAYWKSVAWPQQGVFIGEPLAAPFAPAAVGSSDAGP